MNLKQAKKLTISKSPMVTPPPLKYQMETKLIEDRPTRTYSFVSKKEILIQIVGSVGCEA